jgi:hypothetical protein
MDERNFRGQTPKIGDRPQKRTKSSISIPFNGLYHTFQTVFVCFVSFVVENPNSATPPQPNFKFPVSSFKLLFTLLFTII